MSSLTVFVDDNSEETVLATTDREVITAVLREAGIRFEQWQTKKSVTAGDGSEKILQA